LKILQLARELVLVTQLLADRLQLLVEIELLLVLVHLRAHLALDLALEAHDLQLPGQGFGQLPEPRGGVRGFEQVLLHRDLHQQVGGDRVRQLAPGR
jgi:hypothetical protein